MQRVVRKSNVLTTAAAGCFLSFEKFRPQFLATQLTYMWL